MSTFWIIRHTSGSERVATVTVYASSIHIDTEVRLTEPKQATRLTTIVATRGHR